MKIGYARVSTTDQNLARQESALRDAGAVRVYAEHASGMTDERRELRSCLRSLEAGDMLIVSDLDRLGRSLTHLVSVMHQLGERGIHLRIINANIDTSTPGGQFVFAIMAALAQMERAIISERTLAGLAAARAAGRVGGRPTVMTEDRLRLAQDLRRQGMPLYKIAAAMGVSKTTIVRHLAAVAADNDRVDAVA